MFEYLLKIFSEFIDVLNSKLFYNGMKKKRIYTRRAFGANCTVQWNFYDLVENVDGNVKHMEIYNFRKWFWMECENKIFSLKWNYVQ